MANCQTPEQGDAEQSPRDQSRVDFLVAFGSKWSVSLGSSKVEAGVWVNVEVRTIWPVLVFEDLPLVVPVVRVQG